MFCSLILSSIQEIYVRVVLGLSCTLKKKKKMRINIAKKSDIWTYIYKILVNLNILVLKQNKSNRIAKKNYNNKQSFKRFRQCLHLTGIPN